MASSASSALERVSSARKLGGLDFDRNVSTAQVLGRSWKESSGKALNDSLDELFAMVIAQAGYQSSLAKRERVTSVQKLPKIFLGGSAIRIFRLSFATFWKMVWEVPPLGLARQQTAHDLL